MSTLKGFVLAAALAGLASGATAAPLNYSEVFIGGELPLFPTTALPLDFGINTVAGGLFNSYSSSADFDSFLFALPAGGQVDSITLSYELFNNGASTPSVGWSLAGLYQAVSFLSGSSVDLFPAALPITGSEFLIQAESVGCGCTPGEGWAISYVITVTVSEIATPVDVPEPAGLSLAAVSCGAFWLARRRRQQAGV